MQSGQQENRVSKKTMLIRLRRVGQFSARGMTHFFGMSGRFVNSRRAYNMDLWAMTNGLIKVRLWSRCKDVNNYSFELTGLTLLPELVSDSEQKKLQPGEQLEDLLERLMCRPRHRSVAERAAMRLVAEFEEWMGVRRPASSKYNDDERAAYFRAVTGLAIDDFDAADS